MSEKPVLSLKEEHRLRVMGVLWIFGTERGEVLVAWKKLHSKRVHNLY
jgi:hypothetical protein